MNKNSWSPVGSERVASYVWLPAIALGYHSGYVAGLLAHNFGTLPLLVGPLSDHKAEHLSPGSPSLLWGHDSP